MRGAGKYGFTGEVKNRLIVLLTEMVAKHQERRAEVTDEVVAEWMMIRPML